jgi:hypothetical protein
VCNYEHEQYLLRQLKVKNEPRKHWSEINGWKIGEYLHGCVLAAFKAVVQFARIISINADEVTTIDNTCWGWGFMCMYAIMGKNVVFASHVLCF